MKNTIIQFLITVSTAAIFFCGCEKEYSYEGGGTPTINDTIITEPDTVVVDPGTLPTCIACHAGFGMDENTWGFKTNNSQLCGQVDTAFVLNLERSTFTFFGASACGSDTGLVFTVYMGTVSLDRDIVNTTAANAVFFYYHTGFPYILYSQAGQPFTLTIENYNHVSRVATGIFSGAGFRQDGRIVNVSDGRFTIRLL